MNGIAIITVIATLLLCAPALQAQQDEPFKASVAPQAQEVAHTYLTLASPPAISGDPLATAPDGPIPAQTQAESSQPATANDRWHVSVTPYIWFPGVHGTVGALGRDISYSASPGDLLSHFRFGLMGTVEARHKRLLLPIDLMWVRLEDDKAIPFPPALSATSATFKADEFILTPKVGVRVIDTNMFKIDALAGIRYWHFSENLQFNPSLLGLNFSRSQNWVDPVVGGRIEAALAPKVVATVGGDVGGWGVGSQLDYQVSAALGYKVKPHTILQGGMALFVRGLHKRGSGRSYCKGRRHPEW